MKASASAPSRAAGGSRLRRLIRLGPDVARDAAAVGLLLLFCVAFYRQLALAGRILVSVDAFAYFHPNLAYLGESLRAGRLPLWNPYLFAGVPFLANSQTGVLYPPSWLAAALPPALAYSWLVVSHVALAAGGAYAFARRGLGLGRPGAVATALVFAFGGFFSAQVGHLNQLEAASWLPLLLLATDELLKRPRVRPALLGGVALGLQLLAGHSQVTYLSLWALALYAAAFAGAALRGGLRAGDGPRALAARALPCAGALLLLGAVGVGLAAAQLLPTVELSRESIRAGGLDYLDAASFSLPPWKTLLALLPTFGGGPVFSEYLGYVGVSGLLLAGLALALKPDRRVAAMLGLALFALALAIGKFNPLYALAYRHVPGLDLFRAPARWLLLYSLGVAGLAGLGLDALLDVTPRRRRALLRLLALAAAVGLLLALYQVRHHATYPLEWPDAATLRNWASVGGLGLALVALRWAAAARGRPRAAVAVLAPLLLAGELLAASGRLDLNRTTLAAAATQPLNEVEFFHRQPGLYRVLSITQHDFELGAAKEIKARLAGQLSPEGLYDYLVVTKLRESLTPNLPLAEGIATLDGYDGGVLPLGRYADLKALFPAEGEDLSDGRLWIQLRTPPDPRLLAWLNVRYLVMDRARDLWLAGVYYDLSMPRAIGPGQTARLAGLAAYPSVALGVVGHLAGTGAPPGAEVAAITLVDADGGAYRWPLRAGVETAEGEAGAAGLGLAPVASWLDDPSGHEYAARLAFPRTLRPARIDVEYLWPRGELTLRAASLLGAEPGSGQVVDLSPDLKLAYLGDTKVYENQLALPRAFVVGQVRLAADDGAALAALRAPDFDARTTAVVVEREWRAGGGAVAPGAVSAAVVEYLPERVVVDADLGAPGLLVLTDSAYPGWRALVDGREAPILRADYLFRGVWLPAGQHRVEFVYEPTSLRLGLGISAATAALAVAVAAASAVRRRPRRG